MKDALEQQFINETIALLKTLNGKYKEFFHYQLITIVPMNEDTCNECKELNSQCKRLVIGIHEDESIQETK